MPHKLSHFWQELKRRKVIHVTVVYASVAFVILEAVDIIFPRMNFPDWTVTFVMILLAAGFPIALIFSWIYDVTPEGLEKTRPSLEIPEEERSRTPDSWRIATFVSAVIIVGLIIMNIIGAKKLTIIDKSLANSIAVLPFQNYSTEPDQEAMCLGLTDEIINHLYRIESFDKVVSLTSVLKYRTPDKTISEIASELGVNYILEGVYKKIDDDLAVSAQLIEPSNDRHIWQQDYNRPYSDIMAIQSDIALQIAYQINAFIKKEEKERIEKIPTSSQQAYEIVQGFVVNWMKGNFEEFENYLTKATRAIELDPAYADAYALYALDLLGDGMFFGEGFPLSELIDARKSFEKAIELDNESSLAHVAKASFEHFIEWDFVAAEREYLISRQFAKGEPMTEEGIFILMHQMNRPDDALAYSDELSDWWRGQDLRCYITAGKEGELMDILKNRPVKYEKIPPSWVADLYLWMGEMDSALCWMELAMSENDPYYYLAQYQSVYAVALQATGKSDHAKHIISQLEDHSKNTSAGSPAFCVGTYFSFAGQQDSAFFWLERAYKAREMELPWLKVHPAFENLKDDPRYRDLYERTGFKAYDDYMASKNQRTKVSAEHP